jgi:hypothetical protein
MRKDVFSVVVYSKNVIEFVTVANEYCSFVEAVDDFSRKDFLSRLQKLLPLIYLKAALLPKPDSELPDEVSEKFVSEDDYNFILNKLTVKFGKFDAYQEIYDSSFQYSQIPIEGSIAENISDIYQDLKDFILSYRIGTVEVMNDALKECRTNFEEYWGQRLVNGLRVIHNLLYSDSKLDEEDETLKHLYRNND